MQSNLNPTEVAAWMREQASQFTIMAKQIEATFGLNGQSKPISTAPQISTYDQISTLLRDGTARRAGTIAQELNISEKVVHDVVNAHAELGRNERGWIALHKNFIEGR